MRNVGDVLPGRLLDFFGNEFARYTGNRIFTGTVYIGYDQLSALAKALAVLFEEELRPSVAVRLEETDDAVGPHVAGSRQGRIDFRRMMGVVIDDPNVADKAPWSGTDA